MREEGSDTLVLATAPGTEVRIPRSQVTEIQPGAASLMPQGFDQMLTPQELADLIAFLKGSKG